MIFTPLLRFGYKNIAKPIFFRFDPEAIHDHATNLGKSLGNCSLSHKIIRSLFHFEHPSLKQNILGIDFPNPIGLAAGFDKNAFLTQIIPEVGFGFEEIGSVTAEPCSGNPKPRLWRLPKTKGLVVYYGLKNDGCEVVVKRLKNLKFKIPLGISVAKTNKPEPFEINKATSDYVKSLSLFQDAKLGDYFTINISCPNLPEGEPFLKPDNLETLLKAIDSLQINRPIFVKIPVDISDNDVQNIVATTDRHHIAGFVISNLTKRRNNPLLHQDEIKNLNKGGISGKPMFDLSNDLLSRFYKLVGNRYILIGTGGISSAQDAYEKIRRGASLVQLITGMIFEGPQLIGEINRGLVELLKKDGFESIKEAVGASDLSSNKKDLSQERSFQYR